MYDKKNKSKYDRAYYLANTEKVKALKTKWKKEHPFSWRCEHDISKDRCSRCSSIFCEHEKCKRDCSLCSPESVYKQYLSRAKRRHLDFALTCEEFVSAVSRNCDYCGRSPQQCSGMGIDRIDNSVGYTFCNSAPCCAPCNFMKKSMSLEEFLDHLRIIAVFQKF
jgi:hypothetical protein